MDIRRMIFLMIFSVSSVWLWQSWQAYNAPKVPTSLQTQETVPSQAIPQASLLENMDKAAQAPAAVAAPLGQVVQIETDLFYADIASTGGNLVGLTLKNYKDREDKSKDLKLLSDEHQYRIQSGLIGPVLGLLPDHNTVFSVISGKRSLEDGVNTLELRLETPSKEGLRVAKIYTFTRGSYLVDIRYDIKNASEQTIAPNAYFQIRRDGKPPAGEAKMTSTFTGPAIYTAEGKYQKIDFSSIDKGKAKFVEKSQDGWIGMVQHFFVSAFIPKPDAPRKFYVRKIDEPTTTLYDAGVIVPVPEITAGGTGTLSMSLFVGPQIQSTLEMLAKPVAEGGLSAEGLPRVVDYGWLTIVAAPIFWSLEAIHKLVGNWGWSIVLLTVIIKLLFFPLSAASYKSMARMKALAPRMTALKERYSDDRQKLNMEMMSLYKTEKINPLGGCLPIAIQIPVFIALYWALLGAVEMRDAPWILWITDLSSQDPFYILPVIMVGTMWLQTSLNPTPPDPIQAKVTKLMPFIFGFMFFWFPAGLVLYWCVNNTLSIAQQWQINRMIEKGKVAANDAKA